MTTHDIQAGAHMRFVAPCQGGWCLTRTSCAHYLQPSTRDEPADRLCKPGEQTMYEPLGFHPAQRAGVPA